MNHAICTKSINNFINKNMFYKSFTYMSNDAFIMSV